MSLPVVSRIGACPLDCPDGCSWIVDLENGQPVRLRGNPDHPFTGKALCAKTARYLDYVADPNRLLYPMRRIGKKGEGKFERTSWDKAMDAIARNLQETIENFGAEAIWPYAGSGTVGWIQGIVGAGKRLFHHLGASRHDPNICSAAGHAGIRYTSGSAAGLEPEDLVLSKLILLWGTNTVETNQHLWPFISRARRNNEAVIVCVDPIRTATAKRSDLHIPLRPGTDGALALGLMHQLAQMGVQDDDFLVQRTIGWEQFSSDVLPKHTLKKTADICGVELPLVNKLVELISSHSPMGIKTAMGVQQHGGGGQALRVLSCLPAVTGDYVKAGGGLCYSTGPAYGLNSAALCRPDLQPNPTRILPQTRLGSSLLEMNDPPIKSLIIWAGNPVVSNPNQQRVRKGLAREDLFTVVIENFMTDTADYADIVLPSTMQTEHLDVHDSFSHLYIQLNEPIVEPPGECLPHTEIFRRLASAMNLKEPALYASDDELLRDTVNSDNPAMAGISPESLRERGWVRMSWQRPFQPFLHNFATASGKFEFRSEKAEADGHGLFPHFVPPYEAADKLEDGSFLLLTTANKRLLNSVYGIRSQHTTPESATVTLNPADADRLDLVAGNRVRVWNTRGEYTASLLTDDAIQLGMAHSPKGLWPKFNHGQSVNATVAERDADMAQGALFKDNRVFIEPTAKVEKGSQ